MACQVLSESSLDAGRDGSGRGGFEWSRRIVLSVPGL